MSTHSVQRSPEARAQLSGRLLALVAVLISALTLRIAVTALSPVLDVVAGDLSFGPGLIGWIGMLPPLLFALSGLATPALVRRFDLHAVAITAMVLNAVGTVVRTVGGESLLMLGSAIALAGMGAGNVVIPPLVKRYFPDRIAALSMVYIAFLQIGTLVPPLVSVQLTDAFGWRWALAGWAVVPVAAVAVWVLLINSSQTPDQAGAALAAEPQRADSAAQSAGRVWRSSVAWGLALTFAMTSLNTYTIFAWLPLVLTDAGYSPEFGGAMTSLFSVLGLPAALLAPWLASRLRNPYVVVVLSMLSFAGGYAGLYFSPEVGAALWVTLLGLGASPFPLVLTLINFRTRTQRGAAALSGFSQGFGYLVAVLGPLTFGALHTALGGWGTSYAFLAGTLVLGLIGGALGCRERMLEDTWGPRRSLATRS